MYRALASPKAIGAKTDTRKYMELVDYLLNPANTAKQGREKILEYQGNGWISSSHAQSLYKGSVVPGGLSVAQRLMTEEAISQEQALLQNQKGFMKTAVDMLKKAGEWYKITTPSGLIMELFRRKQVNNLSNNQVVQEARKILKEEAVKTHPSIGFLNEVPNYVVYGEDEIEEVYPTDANAKRDESYE